MPDGLRLKVFHVAGLSDCVDGQEIDFVCFEDKFYIENSADGKMLLELSADEVDDFQVLEQEEVKKKFSAVNAVVGYALFGVAGAVLGGLTGRKKVYYNYIYLVVNGKEYVFACNADDAFILLQFACIAD